MSGMESKRKLKKVVTCQNAKPRRVRLVIGARLQAMTWVRTKGPINKGRGIIWSKVGRREIWLTLGFDCCAYTFAASTWRSMRFFFLFLIQPPSNDSPVSASFTSVPSARRFFHIPSLYFIWLIPAVWLRLYLFILTISFFLAVLSLWGWVLAFSSCGQWGLLWLWNAGFSGCRAWALELTLGGCGARP